MKKEKEIFVGDKIRTNKKFIPVNVESKPIELTEFYDGVIIDQIGKYYVIDFNQEFEWSHGCNQLLKNFTGYFLEENEFDVIESYTNPDKTKELLVKVLKAGNYAALAKVPEKIKSYTSSQNEMKSQIEYYSREVTNHLKRLLDINNQIKALEKSRGNIDCEISKIEKQVDKFTKNKKIKSVEFHNLNSLGKYLIFSTDDLYYHCSNRDVPKFNLGAYKIFVPLTSQRYEGIVVANYKRQNKGNNHHPCINSSGGLCLGAAMKDVLDNFMTENRIFQAVNILLAFLEEPDYGTPFTDARNVACFQPVTIQPRDPSKWIDASYWSENEQFDSVKYNTDIKKVNSCFSGGRMSMTGIWRCPECDCLLKVKKDDKEYCKFCDTEVQ